VRHALKERRTLYGIAPHLVRPLNFVLPMWKGPRASPLMVSAGLVLYDLMAYGKQPVPRHKFHRPRELLARYPFVDPERLLGGFRYGDCQEDDARMTLVVVAAAQSHGAVCANRMRAEALIEAQGRICGARVRDVSGGSGLEVRAKVVVNAAGPWAPRLLGGAAPKVKLIKGTHIVLPAIAGCNEAFLLTAKDGRVFFVIPWYGHTLVGTTEQQVTGPEDALPNDDETRYLLEGVRKGLPGIHWTEADVIGRFAGARMLQAEDTASLAAVTREFEVLNPRPGVLMHVGGKFTTSRSDSTEIVDKAFQLLGRKAPRSVTHARCLPGAPPEPFERWQSQAMAELAHAGVDAEAARWLSLRHGTGIRAILNLIAQRPELAHRVDARAPFILAEAVHAVRAEMAGSIDDVVRRRMPLSLLVGDQAWRPALEALLRGEGAAV
jgi:glycerol-3-phosphate dehydrogenase